MLIIISFIKYFIYFLQLNTGEMKQATRDALKAHLRKQKAGDKANQKQVKVPTTICCAHPSIRVSEHPSILASPPHPPAIPIPKSLPSRKLLSDHPAPRQHAHHHPRQHPCPQKHLTRASPRPCGDLAKELIDFARRFKNWRMRLGVSQREVSLAVNCSQTTISNFENLYLSFQSMRKLKPQLQTWLDERTSTSRSRVCAS